MDNEYEPNDFQKKMMKKYPQFSQTLTAKRDKSLTEEEMKKEYERVYGDDI